LDFAFQVVKTKFEALVCISQRGLGMMSPGVIPSLSRLPPDIEAKVPSGKTNRVKFISSREMAGKKQERILFGEGNLRGRAAPEYHSTTGMLAKVSTPSEQSPLDSAVKEKGDWTYLVCECSTYMPWPGG